MPNDRRDTLDLSGMIVGARTPTPDDDATTATRPYLRLWFTCANLYARAYKDRSGRRYVGQCPKCGKTVRFAIGPEGTNDRQFRVSCE